MYNYSWLESQGYIARVKGTTVALDEASSFYYIIGSVIGLIILCSLMVFLVWNKVYEWCASKYKVWKERKALQLLIENQKQIERLKLQATSPRTDA